MSLTEEIMRAVIEAEEAGVAPKAILVDAVTEQQLAEESPTPVLENRELYIQSLPVCFDPLVDGWGFYYESR